MGLKSLDIITLNDNIRYVISGKTTYNDKNYVYIVALNDPANIKLCEEILENGQIILEEVIDDDLIQKILPSLIKNGIEFLKKEKI